MKGKIPQAFIDDLIERTDIVSLIGSRVTLRKSGHQYIACCPFHNEKTPSFTVSPQKQFYHCFGCGTHGTAISFLIAFDHLNFVEAIEELARQAGMLIPGENKQFLSSNQKLYDLLAFSANFYAAQLKKYINNPYIKAFIQKRELTYSIIDKFQIGLALPYWDNLLKAIPSPLKPYIEPSGLIIDKGETHSYDRFRNRFIFSIHNRQGKVIGFGGRLLENHPTYPKYLNSPETPLFHKRKELYGLYQVIQASHSHKKLLVVEGYMDVLTLFNYGIEYVVATLGTATTVDHLTRLFQITSTIVFCFDGDNAGKKAAWHALETVLPLLNQGREVQFIFLPHGEDPDSLVRSKGRSTFEEYVKGAQPLSEVLLNTIKEKVNLYSIDGRARFIELIWPLIRKIPSGIYQDMLLIHLAEIAKIEYDVLVNRLRAKNNSTITVQELKKNKNKENISTPAQKILTILIQNPHLITLVPKDFSLDGVVELDVELLNNIIKLLIDKPNLNTAALLEYWRNSELYPYLGQLVKKELFITDEDIAIELESTINCLRKQIAGKQATILANHLALSDTEQNELRALLAVK
ncbi:DNA primase [Candidatus Nitrosacidococcus tergens]|uniref:DNA primase n=1 Tax=Candidatus Nitrosacidococcus tergens TaxID=553981 RepID=A0A7G1Q753_9GAMM|nr:DNA primase [Candidatus Nitrosacidococcus tergens]CAB1274150.1 DNA primase [Candidatus Nitrosacidococcus tergens]